MAKWTAFPHAGEYTHDAASLHKLWGRLHAGDAEPMPGDARVLEAWALGDGSDNEERCPDVLYERS